jgi:hypothetical protein
MPTAVPAAAVPAAAPTPTTAARLSIAEARRDGEDGQNDAQDNHQFACHRKSFPSPSASEFREF